MNVISVNRAYAALLVVAAAGLAVVPTARASGVCDSSPADAVNVLWNSQRIAPSGSLPPASGATSTLTATNGAGTCVAGAQVMVSFTPTPAGGGTANSGTATRLTPNWTTLTTDGNGQIQTQFTTPGALPNDGSDTLSATIPNVSRAASSYTYGSVRPTASPLSAVEGRQFSGSVGSAGIFNFASAPTLQGTISWGDGTASAASITVTSTNTSTTPTYTATVSGTHTYAEESPAAGFVTSIRLGGPTTATVTAAGSAAVTDAPLAATGTTLSARRRTSFTASLAQLSDADPGGMTSDFTATVDWGDGATATAQVAAGTGGFVVTGTHAYSSTGTYSATVQITDGGGASATARTAIRVTNGK